MATRLYGQYRVEDVLLARFPDQPTHVKRLAKLLPEAELGSVSGAAARLRRWHGLLERTAPGTYQLSDQGRARRAQLQSAMKTPAQTDFEAEWAALPRKEGVLASGQSALGAEPTTPERLERAAAFMRCLENHG